MNLDRENRKEIDKLAARVDRDRSYLINEAVGSYLARVHWEEEHIKESLRQARAGQFATDAQVEAASRRSANRGRHEEIRYTTTAVADLYGARPLRTRAPRQECGASTRGNDPRSGRGASRAVSGDGAGVGQVPGTRELVLTRINVVVAYRVEGEELWVLLLVLRAEHE